MLLNRFEFVLMNKFMKTIAQLDQLLAVLVVSVVPLLCSAAEQENQPPPAGWLAPSPPYWPQFRGPNSQGVTESAHPPLDFSATSNVVWNTAVPPGYSSLCIWGRRIFLTSFEEGKLETRAYDRATGKRLWQQPAPVEQIEKVQPINSPASSTPVANAERVCGYFGSYGALCYVHNGKELWRKPLPTPKNQYGNASSPALYREWVVLVLDSDDKDSKLIALQIQDGAIAWQTDRPLFSANWSPPMSMPFRR